ncbi:MAG TPA: NAD-dependent DNA ligase LigA, partial [Saprospiraceae bacterium]|nr:NAD-dependent DNA ligase LigA [Saprospiraceae bacterium]
LGFLVPKIEKKKCTGIKEVFDFINYWAIKRDSYDYELDGMVIKLNDLGLQEQCGYTAHHPRWAVAYKFQAKQATSVLLQVDFQIGKIGSITPVAKIEPVQLAGVTVSSISLHNEDFIRTKDIFLRDTVLVERAGDVIPYIVKSFPELRGTDATPIVFPSVCPDCKTKLVREEDEAAWRCPNFHCPSQVIQRLIHHVSKDAMNIDGLGASLIERFYELGWIKNMADIYRLDYDAISRLEGMGLKSAEKLRMSVSIAKQNPIHRLLHGLCIHHLGKKISKLIAEHLDYVPNLFDWTLENYTSIKDVGPVVGENIIAFFQDPENKKMLKEMELLGVNMLQTEEDKPRLQNQDGVFSGKTILFTGTLSQMDRRKAQELAEKAGAKILSAVSGHLNILVVGTDAGSKLEKAKKIGTVEILTEEEFLSRIG